MKTKKKLDEEKRLRIYRESLAELDWTLPTAKEKSDKMWKTFKDHLDNPNFSKETSFVTMKAVIDKLEQTSEITDGLLKMIVRFLKKEWMKKHEKEKRQRRQKEREYRRRVNTRQDICYNGRRRI